MNRQTRHYLPMFILRSLCFSPYS